MCREAQRRGGCGRTSPPKAALFAQQRAGCAGKTVIEPVRPEANPITPAGACAFSVATTGAGFEELQDWNDPIRTR